MLGQPITQLIPPERVGEEDAILRSIRNGVPVDHLETERLRKDGQSIEVSITASPIRDAAGVVVGASKIEHDVSERQRARETLLDAEERMRKQRADLDRQEKSLREKEGLLREIHHRVKNNLQVVSSLLGLQLRGASNQETAKSLQESQNRIHSMALLHETLYQSENLAAVDFPEYVHRLADHLFRSYGLGERVRFRVDLEPLCLDMDAALPCGLIINEVISNSLKHGFPESKRGEVRIVLRASSPGIVSLLLADDGIGIDGRVDWTTTRSLGLRLVRTLAKQLSAQLEIDSRNGTEVRLTFAPGTERTAS
jgi:two-component sensor histidine kinase